MSRTRQLQDQTAVCLRVSPFAFASAKSDVAFKVFLTAQPQKKRETGNVVLAGVGTVGEHYARK
jgi:imidazoleglycerol phosphate synthase glutamine amidotransferase subunit HisH